jgi:hypothetical protein
MKKAAKVILIILGVLAVLGLLIFPLSYLVADFMWWSDAGFLSVTIKLVFIRVFSFLLPFVFAYAFMNLWIQGIHNPKKKIPLTIITLALSVLCGVLGVIYWELFIWNIGARAQGYTDPIFGLDAYFYMFRLPLFRVILMMMGIIIGTLFILDIILHNLKGNGIIRKKKIHLRLSSLILLIVGTFCLLLFIFSNLLEVLIEQPHPKIGVGFSAVNGLFYGYFAFMALILIILILLIIRSRRGISIKSILIYTIILGAVFPLATMLYPHIVNHYYVLPNELMVQREFVRNRIEATRRGFNIELEDYTFNHNIDTDLPEILSKMRVWDIDPYMQVVRQLQEIRTYFEFIDIDVDKYTIGEKVYQVVVAPRELNISNLPFDAQNWDNIHLRYTHGYGVVISPANMVSEDGNPIFWVSDLDNVSQFEELEIDYPQIYFGEKTDHYILVHTQAEEMRYSSDTNISTRYQTGKGIKIGCFFNRLIHSIVFADRMMLLTKYITPESKILYRRNIHERVRYIFPYLKYDKDPYITIIDGKLYWIMDAYTVSDRFPIAQRYETVFGDINYIRNSVKLVIDAYSGEITYYITDKTDPILNAYRYIFPELFETEIPEKFARHFRYPEPIFIIQSEVLCTYHISNYESFYNAEDVWDIPYQIYGEERQKFIPYYTLAKVDNEYQFALIKPFNPIGKELLSSWLIAYYDKTPRMTLRYIDRRTTSLGPMQVESRINQDDTMARLFSLWGMRGSKVFRGNIQFIPLEGGILYLEPIFLEAEDSSIPQLVKIIAVIDGVVFQGDNFNELIQNIRLRITGSPYSTENVLTDAYRLWLEAEKSRLDGNINAYQDNVDKIGEALKRLLGSLEY